jgi:beta-D-xylosidase 4
VLAYFKAERSAEAWAARRKGTNGETLTANGEGALLTPIKQLFDYTRVRDVAAGGSATITFEVTAADLAEVDEKTGDLVSEAATYTLMFDDGGGQIVNMTAVVTGARKVLELFPTDE